MANETAHIDQQPGDSSSPSGSIQISLCELQRMEAEWVSVELGEFVKLIQRYRALYISAIFIAVGWVLGQAVGSAGSASLGPNGGVVSPATLESFRQRQDIAAVLCIVPLLNCCFALLVAETYANIKSLARYRFILGYALGSGTPVWRWERWRECSEGRTHVWTNSLAIFSGCILLSLTVGALVFPFPAVWSSNSWWLWSIWGLALGLSIALVIVLTILGKRNWNRNAVSDPPTIQWSDLGQSIGQISRPEDSEHKEPTSGAPSSQ